MGKFFSRHFYVIFYPALSVFLICLFSSSNAPDAGTRQNYAYRASNSFNPVRTVVQNRIKVVFPFEKRLSSAYAPFGPGMDEELLALFLAETNREASFFYARGYKEAMELVRQKRCDLMVGFGGDFGEEHGGYFARGPVYASVYPVVVKTTSKIRIDNMYSNMLHSSVADMDSGSVFLLDPQAYSVLFPLHEGLRVQGALKEPVGYRWFWNADDAQLTEQMEAFWENAGGGELLVELRERYYGFMPKTSRHQDLRVLAQIITEKMDLYSEAIAKAAEETGLDPLLIAAVIFQESRFDPEATSYTGVRGLMQLTSDTAKMLKVDRLDPEQSILGGTRYLRYISDSLQYLDISEWDRWCLTLAAYNQGPANVRNALRLAETRGLGQNWTELREVYARLQDSGVASKGFRPQEALDYVENVRYYYYVMSRLVTMADGEKQNFAPLLFLRTSTN
ncbi:MAG: transglycosylase SLT domain-containing protein [Deltaproteobacteria bacterium]|jgi:membrane-bound lytic murein transglycosylase F|nr:transglycosylase SLT domain-containing protein [Deltaproteobacteria bacterium]